MKSRKKVLSLIGIIMTLSAVFLVSFLYYNHRNDINVILKEESYAYLSKAAQNYIKEIYEETGELVLTEKNREVDKPYLNPDYVEYLNSGKASEYGYIPNEFIIEHSYSDDIKYEKNGVSDPSEIESLPYYNLRDDGYITNVYDQGSEGLCWAFASATSLESHLAMKSNKTKMLTFSEKQVDYATTNGSSVLDVGNNPYITTSNPNIAENLNEGGNMLRFAQSTAIGISPVLCEGNCSDGTNYNHGKSITDNKYWKYDYNFNSKLSPYEVINFDNTEYSVNEALFFDPLVKNSESEVNALVRKLKKQIVNNGSLYVGVGAYTNLSVKYVPTTDETALNSDGKNVIYYIPYGWSPSGGINHAVSVIGWDDNYTHNVCLNKTDFEITDADKKQDGSYYCLKGDLHTINGAWILQNSWGTDENTYLYLPYDSMKSPYSSISDVEEVDFDNSYRATDKTTSFKKGTNAEKLEKVKFFVDSYYTTIYISYSPSIHEIEVRDSFISPAIMTLNVSQPGLYTVDLSDQDIIFGKDVSNIKLKLYGSYLKANYFASIHTSNVDNDDKYVKINNISKYNEGVLENCSLDDNKCLSKSDNMGFNDNNLFVISGETRNLKSSDNLIFKILNDKKEDVTNLFHIFRNFSVSNYFNTLISYNNKNVDLGNYTIEIYYNENKYDEMEWNLSKHNNIFSGIGTEEHPYEINSVEELNEIRNHKNSNYLITGYYVLNEDLDLAYDTTDKKGMFYNSGAGWEPIYNFAGNFNGNNHIISGLYINRPKTVSEEPVGLFGTVYGKNTQIENLILKDVNINGNFDAGALAGYVYSTSGIEINNISVVGGKVISRYHSGGLIGVLTRTKNVTEKSICNFYNIFSDTIVGTTDTTFSGGIVGGITNDNNIISASITDSVSFSKVSGNGSSGDSAIGGIVGFAYRLDDFTIKNVIVGGSYETLAQTRLGDTVGDVRKTNSLTINGVWHTTVNKTYGSVSEIGTQSISNNTTKTFSEIVNSELTNYFEHNTDWTQPEVENIKRIPMLTTLVDKFDFTDIDNFELKITGTKSIYDLISPKTENAKNITYTYDSDYLTISDKGIITPKKLGETTIHIDSLYDGYSNDIQVSIVEVSSITFNSNNGSDETNTQEVSINSEFKLNKNEFTYKGHTFKNWNTQADGKGTPYSDEQLFEEGINSVLVLYAQWNEIEYTITFDSNGGEGEVDDWVLTYPEKGTITIGGSSFFTKENYILDSWNTKSDGTGTKYLTSLKDYSIDFDTIPFDDNYKVTLYAQWKKVEYIVTFDSNGGSGTMDNQNYAFDETKTLQKNIYTKDGHTFKNWNTQADGKGTPYSDEQEISLSENIKLYAQWTLNKETITFDSNGGSGAMQHQQLDYNISGTLNANVFEKEHYKFDGWNTKADGTGTPYSDKGAIKILDNITLYAQWSPESYTVIFDSNGGSGTMDNQKFTYNVSNKLNAVQYTYKGHTFKNWNTKADGTGTPYSDEQEISLSENIKLYAQWNEGEPYTIKRYYYIADKKYMDKIDINTIPSVYKQNIELATGYSIEVESKNVDGKDVLYTGSKTRIKKEEVLIIEFTNIVSGDTNGDGKLNYLDYVNVYNHIQKVKHSESTKKLLTNEFLVAGDMSGDTNINYLDYVKIYQKIKELKGGN